MSELHEHRVKRLAMRSMRRGIKEMDLILSAFADAKLAAMTDAQLTVYDAMLDENDHDLYQWVTGQVEPTVPYGEVIDDIRGFIASRDMS